MKAGHSRCLQRGSGSVELLIALPLVLLAGLALWQWALIVQARQIIDSAIREAVRSGATGNAEVAAIEDGLAFGLAPLWLGASQLGERRSASGASLPFLLAGQQSGWIAWRQISPTREAFADWGVISPQATGAGASPVIPVDNATWRSRFGQPSSGQAGSAGSEAVGLASGQTFRQAGLLRIELAVGIPLHVPFAGRFISWAARVAAGCGEDGRPAPALLNLGEASQHGLAGVPGVGSRASEDLVGCRGYSGPDARGITQPRLPVRVIAEARMQTDARMTSRTRSRAEVRRAEALPASREADRSFSESGSRPDLAPGIPAKIQSPNAQSEIVGLAAHRQDVELAEQIAVPALRAAAEPSPRGSGFFGIGAEREIWTPGSCGINPS